MKNLLLAAILGVTLLAPAMARADASEQGCKSSGEKLPAAVKGRNSGGRGGGRIRIRKMRPPFLSQELASSLVRVYWRWAA
jgi:hypothetical protein